MIHELRDAMVHHDFNEGRLTFNTYVTDLCSDNDAYVLCSIAEELAAEGPEEIGIACHFTVTSILDTMIEFNRYRADSGKVVMDTESKPMFDAFRAELQAMMQRIEAIKFEA